MQPFTCQRDDLTIRGFIYGPATGETVILSHGFTSNQSTVSAYASLIAESGFTAVTFDFCGGGIGGMSDGKTEDMTVLTEKQDLMAVYRFVAQMPGITGISLLGCSQGGFVSALAARELDIHRLILFYPALCIPDDARSGSMQMYKFDPNHIPDVLGKRPMKLGGDYARSVIDMDPFEAISGYTGPVLLLHGTEDNIVDVSYSRRAKNCFPQCEYHEIIGAGHGFSGKYDVEACELLKAFLKENRQ